ncbi:MAG: S8 family serine peptidase [Candidatus Njordarchaeota archaeon]
MKKIKALIIFLILAANILWPLAYLTDASGIEAKKIANSPYIDPAIIKEKRSITDFLILFKDESSLQKSTKTMSKNCEILSKYKIIPMILVRGRPDRILMDDRLRDKIAGIYANKKYELKWDTKANKLGATTNYTAYRIGANVFWENGYDGSGIRVCIIDSGINSTHGELFGKINVSKSFVSLSYGYNYMDPTTGDAIGHGTAVAGIIAGQGIDPRGQGIAPGVVLMNAKVVASGGSITLAGIIAAIEWAVYGPDDNPGTGDEADIINMSLGGTESYHSPTWLAIKKAAEQGILVVCAAGNEGNQGTSDERMLNSMSINDPANAMYSIAVGAVSPFLDNIEEYSSFGPTINMVVKPEISAPSNVIVLDSEGGYTSGAWRGTSFSAPHISGALALLADYLEENLSKINRRDLSWATLMYTASPLFMQEGGNLVEFEDLAVGAGVVNLTKAFNVLSSYTISDENYPQMVTVLPKRLPTGLCNSSSLDKVDFFPYFDRLFVGQTLVFNFSIFASKETVFDVSLSGNISDVLILNSDPSFDFSPPVYYYEINISVRSNSSEGYYVGKIVFNDSIYGNSVEIPMKFNIVKPRARVLMDLKHTDWVVDHRYGQYRFFVRDLEVEKNISVEQLFHDGKMSYDLLSKFDVLLCPDAASAEAILYENGSYNSSRVNNFEPSEIEDIWKFIDNGGILIIFAIFGTYMGTLIHNITNINELLEPTGINLRDDIFVSAGDYPIAVDLVGKHVISRDIEKLPYYGIGLRVNLGLSEPFLMYGNKYLAATYQGSRGGGVIALGTNFIFDNWAYYGLYSGSGEDGENIKIFYDNLASFITSEKSIIEKIKTYNDTLLRGSNITLRVYNTTSIKNATWTYTHLFGNYSGTLYYEETDSYWTAEINLRIAGQAYVKVKAILLDNYYVCRAISFEVEKTENNSPTIRLLDLSNGTTVDASSISSDGFTIRIEITDDEALLPESLNISINLPNYVMNVEESNTSILIEIKFSKDTIEQYAMMYMGSFSIIIKVFCSDVNINTATKNFVIHMEHATYAMMWLVFVIIIVAMMIIIAILILRKK